MLIESVAAVNSSPHPGQQLRWVIPGGVGLALICVVLLLVGAEAAHERRTEARYVVILRKPSATERWASLTLMFWNLRAWLGVQFSVLGQIVLVSVGYGSTDGAVGGHGKRRPDTHGGDARPNHSTVGQERDPALLSALRCGT